jgi:predicted neutral ceramidase superfamily lipid hydrolase
MDQEKLIGYIKNAVQGALKNLEPAEVWWKTITVPDVKVIGAKQIEALCALTDKASKQAKKSAAFLFPVAGVVLVVLLFFL